MKSQLIFVCIGLVFITKISADTCKGCVELDDTNFSKVIKRFPASLVKFDVVYPYGEQHEVFEKFSKDVAASSDILMATIGVKDYGDRANEALAERYHLAKSEYPVLLLFKKDLHNPVRFTETFTAENILKFVKKHDIYIGLPGCIEEFDKLAAQFMTDIESRKSLLSSIDDLIKQQNTEHIPAANIYKTVMTKILERGDDFVESEISRINKLLTGKLESKKESQLSNKLNILQSFSNTKNKDNEIIDKDEL